MTFEAGIFKLSEELNAVVVNPLGLLADDEELKQNFSAAEICFQMPRHSGKSQPQRNAQSESDTEEATDVLWVEREFRKLKVTFFDSEVKEPGTSDEPS
eukprot:GHVP01017146.1.p1 GENE.GHVP01017146.1~~GHVP01017146.1.p1  ORF type:complete len:109 (-),score=20.91 GHVP01017146.1:20-316(-)